MSDAEVRADLIGWVKQSPLRRASSTSPLTYAEEAGAIQREDPKTQLLMDILRKPTQELSGQENHLVREFNYSEVDSIIEGRHLTPVSQFFQTARGKPL